MAVVFDWLEHPEIDLFATFDKALAQLEAGLPPAGKAKTR